MRYANTYWKTFEISVHLSFCLILSLQGSQNLSFFETIKEIDESDYAES